MAETASGRHFRAVHFGPRDGGCNHYNCAVRADALRQADSYKVNFQLEALQHGVALGMNTTETNPNATLNDVCTKIVAAASEAVIFADRDGRIRLWNRGAELLFGYTAAEVDGQSLDIIIPERLRRAHWEAFDRSVETGVTKHVDRVLTTRSMHKNGARLYVDLSFGLVKDAQGAVLGAFAIGRDCTERYLAEANAKARLAAVEAQLAQAPPRPAE